MWYTSVLSPCKGWYIYGGTNIDISVTKRTDKIVAKTYKQQAVTSMN